MNSKWWKNILDLRKGENREEAVSGSFFIRISTVHY
jgi:hypothetical protein